MIAFGMIGMIQAFAQDAPLQGEVFDVVKAARLID